MNSSLVTNKFRYRIVKTLTELVEQYSETEGALYFFYGRPLPWADEESPDTLIQSNREENFTKSNILALKKVEPRDLIMGIVRKTWVSGTQYDAYTNLSDIRNLDYYVITSQNKVYKCLDNNTVLNSEGYPEVGESTVEPSHTSGARRETDNYVWQFMFKISDVINRKFDITSYIPIDISDPITQGLMESATPGTINRISIFSDAAKSIEGGGVGYFVETLDPYSGEIVSLSEIPLYVGGDGDEVATGEILINSVTDQGAINIQSQSGQISGMVDNLYEERTTTSSFLLLEEGSDYRVVEDEWSPVRIRQISAMTSTETEDVDDFTYAHGIARIDENGAITALRIIDPGSGYSLGRAQIVQSSCIAYAKTDINGKINTVRVEYPGENFRTADVTIISDRFIGDSEDIAILEPIISPVKGHGSDPESELNSTAVLFNLRIAYEEFGGDFSTDNDFRSVGLIERIEQQDSDGTNQVFAVSSTLTAKTSLVCTTDLDANEFESDDTIVGTLSGARGKLIDLVDGNTLRIIRDIETSNTVEFQPGEIIRSSSGGVGTLSEVIQPEYVPFSGNILYINNREAIQRSPEQIETINFVLKL